MYILEIHSCICIYFIILTHYILLIIHYIIKFCNKKNSITFYNKERILHFRPEY